VSERQGCWSGWDGTRTGLHAEKHHMRIKRAQREIFNIKKTAHKKL